MNTSDLLNDLEKWQAYSDPHFDGKSEKQLFEPVFAEKFLRLHDDIWHRLCRVHGSLITLERLREFPFEYVYEGGGMEFWRLVGENFVDAIILMLHGLVNDQGSDVNGLRALKNEVCSNAVWLRGEDCAIFRDAIRKCKFDRVIEQIAGRVGEARNNYIAHRLVDKANGNLQSAVSIDLRELRQLFDATHRLFGAISFGGARITLRDDLMPCTIGGKPPPTCLDTVLDAVLRESEFVNFPERQKEFWPILRNGMGLEKLRIMNEIRCRFGLPEA
jgi:hypothetical protein